MFRRRSVRVNGRLAVYWESNPGARHTIVMLHGFRGNHCGLMDVARHLENFRVILPDRPGCGDSEPLGVPHSVPNYARWFDAFLDAISVSEVVGWGHSSGAAISLVHAATGARRPSALVMVTPAVPRRDPLSWITTGYYRGSFALPRSWRRRWLTSRVVERVGDRFLFKDSQRRRAWLAQRDSDRPTLRTEVMCQEYFSVIRLDLARYASAVEVPVLLVGGAADAVTPVRQMRALAAAMRDPTLMLLPRRGHMIPIEEPALIATLTRDHVEKR